ncbi:MAG: Flp pilus assembly protein CpaB [Planctomycetaceae bacterium]|nr:Flp pilus assembly protein CpaB [Planctomycetaceae bacterium]
MNGKSMIVLVLAVVLGLVAMLTTRHFMKRPDAPVEETQEILVAARDFKEEEILKPDMVTTIKKNKKDLPVGAFTSFKDVEDRWVKTTMLEGDPIIEKKLGPKGSPPGLVANIPPGMRAHAVEVSEQSGVSGFILPGHRVDVIRFEPGEKASQHAETILQDILVLAAGQVFTRPEEKALQNRTVTLAVTPEQVETLVAARAKGPLSLSLRGVNDHTIVPQTKPKPELSDEERQQREKVQKELDELRLALAKKDEERQQREKLENEERQQREKLREELAEIRLALAKQPPPPPPLPKEPEPKAPELRWVYIYRPLLDKKDREYPERVAITDAARKLAQQHTKPEDDEEPRGFGFGASAGSNLNPNLQDAPGRNP